MYLIGKMEEYKYCVVVLFVLFFCIFVDEELVINSKFLLFFLEVSCFFKEKLDFKIRNVFKILILNYL